MKGLRMWWKLRWPNVFYVAGLVSTGVMVGVASPGPLDPLTVVLLGVQGALWSALRRSMIKDLLVWHALQTLRGGARGS